MFTELPYRNYHYGAHYRKSKINNLVTYVWAAPMIMNESVLEIAFNVGNGALILSMFAKDLTGADISATALRKAGRHQYFCPTKVVQVDLEKEFVEGKYDTAVVFETIEHLANPKFFLENISKSCKRIIFTVPHNAPSIYHKQVYKSVEEIKADVEPFFDVEWFYERKGQISKEPFNVPHRYIGIGISK